MTELSFLIELLLNHKLAKATKDAVAARIKEVECRTSSYLPSAASPSQRLSQSLPSSLPPHIASQSPSTQALMLKHGISDSPVISPSVGAIHPLPTVEAPQPVAVVAQTPAAVAAVNAREQSIRQAMSGKPMPGETKPRKF